MSVIEAYTPRDPFDRGARDQACGASYYAAV